MNAMPRQQEQFQVPGSPRYPIGSVDRVLQLLLLFRDRRTLRVADAARELGVAASTAHRLLAMLQLHGFIAQDSETRQYVPGPAILELGSALHRHGPSTERAQAATDALSGQLDETSNVSVLQHTSVVFIAGTDSQHTLRIANQTGRRVEAFHSSPGKAMLADLSPERVRVLYPSEMLTDGLNDVTVRRASLEAELDEVRRNGYATNDVPNSSGAGDFLSIAVPIRQRGTAIAALSIAAPAQRVTVEWKRRAIECLRRSAASLEREIN